MGGAAGATVAPQVPPASGANSVRGGDTYRGQIARTTEPAFNCLGGEWGGHIFLSDPPPLPLPPPKPNRETRFNGAHSDPPQKRRTLYGLGGEEGGVRASLPLPPDRLSWRMCCEVVRVDAVVFVCWGVCGWKER